MKGVVVVNNHINYISETLHVDMRVSLFNDTKMFPLYLRNAYELFKVTLYDAKCLLAYPVEQSNLSILRKHCNQIKTVTGMDVVLCLDSVRVYTKEQMLAEGIPFIVPGKDIYMPFLGVALSMSSTRELPNIKKISFLTQKLLLTAIYEGWTDLTLTETAGKLGISKMSVSRCFSELQAMGLLMVKNDRKMRRFSWEKNRRALCEVTLPFLNNPIVQEYHLKEQMDIKHKKLSGMSAISHYSMLNDNNYVTYSVSSDVSRTLVLPKNILVPDNEIPFMVLQVMRYEIKYNDSLAIDPLSAILTLSDEDKENSRVASAIDEILEGCLDG